MPNDTAFYRNDSSRPDPPFARTELSNLLRNNQPVLRRNGIPVGAEHRHTYRLFRADQLVGSYQFTWHHNIPWNILRRSWDVVLTFCTDAALKALFNFYAAGHPLADDAPRLFAKLLLLRATFGITNGVAERTPGVRGCEAWIDHLTDTMRDSPNPRMGFQGEDREKLKTILCWGTWNLNEGPGTRVDDPGELFDTFGPFDAEETRRARYVAVERLNTTLNDIWDRFTEQANMPCSMATTTRPWSAALLETLRVCAALTPSQRGIVYFDPLMWAPVTLSRSAMELFDVKANATFDSGMITEVLRGVSVYKQMKKRVRFR
ncbi:hypothetical protein C8P66_12166 [Humitalea rosea]|uniref:Uncharacterized protein n=1 Tax=Humitalea rosea TaxID=990373 RepID=A0A2W7I545_9PROT|nr:hypothetical protein [Humitalea rosea]PZW41358.1 hypothetical protein C8P66_12166 [Humitalea rosea]